MFFSQDRRSLRQYFFEVWRKANSSTGSSPAALTPLEQIMVEVIAKHPEYHGLLSRDPERVVDQDYDPTSGQLNPFLHLALHLAIYEQVAVDRPQGIRAVYTTLCQRHGDAHEAEHVMLEALGETLHAAQRTGNAPDEATYLQQLQQLGGVH